jgi:hypothetical protein
MRGDRTDTQDQCPILGDQVGSDRLIGGLGQQGAEQVREFRRPARWQARDPVGKGLLIAQ